MLALQLAVTGLQTGALYALTAVGFSLIFGSTRIFHFAHGATFAIAAYFFYFVFQAGFGTVPAILGASAGAIAFGLLIYWLVYVPVQRHEGSFFTVFVASFGVGIAVQNLLGMVFGRGFVTVNTSLSRSSEILPGLYVAPLAWIAIACAIVFLGALHLFLRHTHTGMALRALSDNPELVRIFGLSPQRISAIVFVIGSVLVVPAAIITSATTGLNPAIGHHVMLISLAASIVGGIGSVYGTLLAGLILGLAESMALLFVASQWTEAVTFAILFAFILIRPSGLLGRATAH
ncbi:branched-chain amino acid ABC transporter permease [Roseivivax sp. THAF30]|uniref:branched-chain amino acid ABC transporter permease n=1 Tax=Roseivivax sp. THAF30 TaxID=2587852 RepID=UPI0012694C23|nr:branched-chain amino acid ABC transporter permease [Roseivivax sp. THAF30]QFT62704.1 High-affinity branched-chain amino acid transport system permease protein LivH [Roseivivax sp. THAF30]